MLVAFICIALFIIITVCWVVSPIIIAIGLKTLLLFDVIPVLVFVLCLFSFFHFLNWNEDRGKKYHWYDANFLKSLLYALRLFQM